MPMDSSTAQSHHQEMGSESMLVCTKAEQEKKAIRGGEQGLINCPRCESTNTKFCYYNNYSLSQPRYFCKSCTRYWTKGGTLRNVPVGGGCRKNNKRPSSPSKRSRDHQPITTIPSPILCFNPFSYDSSDLSQAIARIQKQTAGHLGLDDHHDFSISGINPNTPLGINSCAGLLDALRGGILEIPRGFHDLYDGINLGMGNGGMGFEEHSNATTASGSVGREGEGNGGLGGSPWQGIIGGDGQMGDLDSIRLGSWNGIASSNWY